MGTPELPDEGDRIKFEASTAPGEVVGTVDKIKEWNNGTHDIILNVEESSSSKIHAGRRYGIGEDTDWEHV